MPCASCLQKGHRNGAITYLHQMVGAASIHPDRCAVMPLMPEPIVRHDGTAKNEGERHAAKRLVAQLRQAHPHRTRIVTDDRLRATAPHIETLHEDGCPYSLGGKAGEHDDLCQQVEAAEPAGRVTYDERHDRAAGLVPRVRFVNDVPLHASNPDGRVHVMEYWEMGQDTVHHFSWVTDLRGHKRHVFPRMRGGRARWKIANETCNPLNNQGDHFEHNYGHGAQHLSVVLAVLMRLAFLVDQAQPLCWALCQAVWAKLGCKRLLWERMRALCYTCRLDAMRELFAALFYGFKKPRPLLTSDTSSSLPSS